MRIKKVLNSSVVLVEDDAHQESILLGKGIGFGQKPGNVIIENQENQVFLPVDNGRSRQILELVNRLPPVMLELAQEIVLDAQRHLNTPLGENLVFVLADHLNFALERIKTGLVITNRVFWEIKSFYPQEFEAGLHAIELVNTRLKVELPEQEAANIAFHLANAQAGSDPDYDAARNAKLIGDIINLVRYSLNRDLNSQSIHTARFITHIKFFVDRFFTDKLLQNDDDLLFEQVRSRYPKELGIALKIKSYLYDKYERILPNEEVTFLVIHIARIARSQE
ncbi:PRD domain-containing protein [Holdemania massiliensis]|uniref:PRD domain-containing protein n=1 Tax=Holdemania massiliensis TaxID=1468449 RepID=A0A6N7S350_9FIRM|nr:PRD domain-containing protein [Holdemania massiliensis]MSA70369.1 PRD domain-containing protein [Holdemania massiliensis]MSA88100.1 PRD domain-containing protein [Holdemania massiliensis]MSB76929.1 PRD domain-containing protein [Holdemania massiliensis]MSC31855.1 PRD domain-containing protein [Holdemania massiliensis]MSC38175.1 PRD domain-containing protein [Holdemania massiliensis]